MSRKNIKKKSTLSLDKSKNCFYVSIKVVVAQLVEHFLGKEEVVGSSPINSTDLLFVFMAKFDASFWLLVAFLIFFTLVFKVVKNLISSAILKYKTSIVETIETAEEKRQKSTDELHQFQAKTTEIKDICQKIINSAIAEANRIEEESKAEITSYLNFKERYIEEKMKIFTSVQVQEIKKSVVHKSLLLVTAYFESKKGKGFEMKELAPAMQNISQIITK